MSKEYPELLTDADRVAAGACARYFGHNFTAVEIETGEADNCSLLAIITRHRIDGQEEMRRALAEAIRIIEQERDEWLDSAICCSGHDCGCRGSSNRDLIVHDLRAALHTPEEKDNG